MFKWCKFCSFFLWDGFFLLITTDDKAVEGRIKDDNTVEGRATDDKAVETEQRMMRTLRTE